MDNGLPAGCGIDIEELCRFEKIFSDGGSVTPGLIRDVFSDEEISRNNAGKFLLKYALGFSCKEAAFKAFGISWTQGGISWKDIELIFTNNNPDIYDIRLNGCALDYFNDRGYESIDASGSYTDLYAVFRIVLLK